ncbi:MAG: hypothetical protein HRU28_03155, partial [Rhizobiales bacterium]|nr:hypothetical protein [Hyphomicrobiales bacterium]
MGLMPFFTFTIDGKSIGGSISVAIHDEVGAKADSITATIADPNGLALWPIIKDKKCKATIGYLDGSQATFGDYKLNEVSYDYGAYQFTLTGHAVDFSKEAKAKKTRTLEDITLEVLVAK